jgi:hypothetical protein
MCKTQQDPQQTGLMAVPGTVPNTPGIVPNTSPDGANDPLSNAIQKESSSNSQMTAAGGPSPGPTKFGSLLKILTPILEGGAIGAFSGKGHPGGGFGAATDFYNQQRAHQLQMQMFQNTLQNSQVQRALEIAKTNHEINRPEFTRVGAIAMQDANGRKYMAAPDPHTGQYKEIPGAAPVDKDQTPHYENTDQGVMAITGTTAAPVTVPGRPIPPQLNAIPGMPLAPGTPLTTPGKPAPGAPLHAPGFSTPKLGKVTNRNAAGVETDSLVDENPNSPTRGNAVIPGVAKRSPVPDKATGRQDKKDAEDSLIEEHVDVFLQRAGGDPDKAVAAITADKNVPAQYKARMRNRVREIQKRNAPTPTKEEQFEEMMNKLPQGPPQ